MRTLKVRWLLAGVVLTTLLLPGGLGWLGDSLDAARRALAADTAASPQEVGPSAIQRIDLVHLSHTDVGYTDHPIVCRELQIRYLDIAIDAALATENRPEGTRFCWTAESAIGVNDWWRSATPERRADFLKADRLGPNRRCGHGHEQHGLSRTGGSGRRCFTGCRRTFGSGSSPAWPCKTTSTAFPAPVRSLCWIAAFTGC